MQELVTPEQSEQYVLIASVLVTVIAAVWGFRAVGTRGLGAGLAGPLIFALWQFHKYVTRYDPATGYFGLDKVKVLLCELALFIGVGIALGWIWSAISSEKISTQRSQSRHEEHEGLS